jgi:hypothetical protein
VQILIRDSIIIVSPAPSLRVGRLLEFRKINRQANGELGMLNFIFLKLYFENRSNPEMSMLNSIVCSPRNL